MPAPNIAAAAILPVLRDLFALAAMLAFAGGIGGWFAAPELVRSEGGSLTVTLRTGLRSMIPGPPVGPVGGRIGWGPCPASSWEGTLPGGVVVGSTMSDGPGGAKGGAEVKWEPCACPVLE